MIAAGENHKTQRHPRKQDNTRADCGSPETRKGVEKEVTISFSVGLGCPVTIVAPFNAALDSTCADILPAQPKVSPITQPE
jgi:hypothetical protein